jgi:hypothetical protein
MYRRRKAIGRAQHPALFRVLGGCPGSEEIEALERTMEFGKNIEAVPYPSVGEKVQIVDGPLMGVVGITGPLLRFCVFQSDSGIARWKNRHRLILSIGCSDVEKSVSPVVGLAVTRSTF